MGSETGCTFGRLDGTGNNVGCTLEQPQVLQVTQDVISCFSSLLANLPGERE